MIRPYLELNSRSTVPTLLRGGVMVAVAASKPDGPRIRDHGGPAAGEAAGPPLDLSCPSLLWLRLDHLVEHQLAADDLVQTVVGQRGVAVRVDRVRSEHRRAVLRRQQLLVRALTRHLAAVGVGIALDRAEDQRHRLVAVDGIWIGLARLVRRLVIGDEL